MASIQKKQRNLPYVFIVLGFIAFFFSFLITVEKMHLATDPSYTPPCTMNPFISCENVMASAQASVFGFANPLLGIAGFAIVVTMGFAMLAGATFQRWFWVCTQLGMLFGVGFIYWLFYQAVYNIGSLCIYCMIVWAMMIPLFLYTLVHNLRERHIVFLKLSWNDFIAKYSFWILFLMYLVIFISILTHFWSYWVTLF